MTINSTSPTHLTDASFTQQALGDGASRRVSDNHVPTDGYMVGGKRNHAGDPMPEQKHALSEFGEQHVREHLDAIHNHYPNDTSVHQGSWTEKGHAVLDASEHILDRHQARWRGIERKERAIFDVKNKRDINLPRRAVH